MPDKQRTAAEPAYESYTTIRAVCPHCDKPLRNFQAWHFDCGCGRWFFSLQTKEWEYRPS
jgi:hypothetical protein